MRTLGQFLITIGIILGVGAFTMKTTVPTESAFVGEAYIPSREVHNIGLMDDKRNLLILAGLLVIVGVQLILGDKSPTKRREIFEGDRDISSDRYRLYLTREYRIELNTTLGKFVVGDSLHSTLEEALTFADQQEQSPRPRP